MMSWVDPHTFIESIHTLRFGSIHNLLRRRVWIDSRRHWRSTLYLYINPKRGLWKKSWFWACLSFLLQASRPEAVVLAQVHQITGWVKNYCWYVERMNRVLRKKIILWKKRKISSCLLLHTSFLWKFLVTMPCEICNYLLIASIQTVIRVLSGSFSSGQYL